MKESASVLFVCLGNICRSPAAEGVFLHLREKRGIEPSDLVIDSAGTGTWHLGKGADARMVAAAKKRGIALPSICRQIEAVDYRRFTYIVAMDENNFETIMDRCPKDATARIVRMREFVKSSEIDGIPDPYFGGDEGFEYVLDLLEDGCSHLMDEMERKS